jgi:hypothetical protein
MKSHSIAIRPTLLFCMFVLLIYGCVKVPESPFPGHEDPPPHNGWLLSKIIRDSTSPYNGFVEEQIYNVYNKPILLKRSNDGDPSSNNWTDTLIYNDQQQLIKRLRRNRFNELTFDSVLLYYDTLGRKSKVIYYTPNPGSYLEYVFSYQDTVIKRVVTEYDPELIEPIVTRSLLRYDHKGNLLLSLDSTWDRQSGGYSIGMAEYAQYDNHPNIFSLRNENLEFDIPKTAVNNYGWRKITGSYQSEFIMTRNYEYNEQGLVKKETEGRGDKSYFIRYEYIPAY